MDIYIEDAQVTILLEINGKVHLVGMSKERLETMDLLIKKSAEVVIPTDKSQKDLNGFLGYNK